MPCTYSLRIVVDYLEANNIEYTFSSFSYRHKAELAIIANLKNSNVYNTS